MTFDEARNSLIAHGARFVYFEYDGSGDSGDVNSVSLYADNGLSVDRDVAQEELHTEIEADPVNIGDAPIINAVWKVAREASVLIDYDWYNDSGGGGTGMFDMYTGAFVYDGYYRTMDTVPSAGSAFRDVPVYYPPDRELENLFLNPE